MPRSAARADLTNGSQLPTAAPAQSSRSLIPATCRLHPLPSDFPAFNPQHVQSSLPLSIIATAFELPLVAILCSQKRALPGIRSLLSGILYIYRLLNGDDHPSCSGDPSPYEAVKEKEGGGFTASCQEGDAAPIFDLDLHDELTFTYDVAWAYSDVRWASRHNPYAFKHGSGRFDNYLKMTGGEAFGPRNWP